MMVQVQQKVQVKLTKTQCLQVNPYQVQLVNQCQSANRRQF